MASLADLAELVGFFSYSRDDDQGSRGALSALRDAIQNELSAQLGRSQSDFHIWQDKAAIPLGTQWEKEIAQGIGQAAFFVPIVTPRALRSQHCAFEFQSFLAREAELGRDDLVFPILYIPVPALEDEKIWRADPVLKIIGTRQYLDWRELRHHDPYSTEVRQKLERFCRGITSALHKSWVSPQERRRQEEAEARRRSEEEARRKAVQAEAEWRAQEERKHREAEAARRAEEAERARVAEQQARQRAEEEKRRLKTAAEQRNREERAFKAAKHANSLAAIEAFLTAHPKSHLGAQAETLQAVLRTRADAHARAMTSDDPVVLKTFRDAYKKGADVDEVRARLRLVEPGQERQRPKLAIVIPGAVALLLVGAGAVWWAMRPAANSHQASVASPPAQPVSAPRAPATAPPMPAVAPAPTVQPAPVVKPANSAASEPKSNVDAAPTIAPASPAPAAAAPPLPANDVDAWSVVKDTSDTAALRRFIAQFPDSLRRRAAEAQIAAVTAVQAAWDLLKSSNDPDQLRLFIRQFPNSSERAAAERRLAALTGTTPPTAAPAPAAPAPAATTPALPPAAPIAAAPPAPAATAALTPPANAPDPHELTRLLQFELMRVGCFAGKVTGAFDDDTKAAWHNFIKRTSKEMPDDVSPDAIKAVRGVDQRVCPLVCPRGEHAEGDVCVVNEPPPSKRAAKRRERESEPEPSTASPPAAAAPTGGAPCVAEHGSFMSGSGLARQGCR